MSIPQLIWDCGTAYDLFVSLVVLHEPAKYGLRGAWARGVRARLDSREREILDQATTFVLPMHWVHTLPDPKDGKTALRALEQISPAERLSVLTLPPQTPQDVREILKRVDARGSWEPADLDALQSIAKQNERHTLKKKDLSNLLTWWSRPRDFGERYLEALLAYHEAFFAEEERRIRPALEEALAKAQALAPERDLSDLLALLSQGVHLAQLPRVPELVLAPSFWSTPLMVFAQISDERELILFGARPSDASLVPGESVPDVLMRALKALGHPTRLRILRYLVTEPLTPTQLANRLRLRPPTVVHHLDTLRLAELVHLTLEEGQERRYAARFEAVRNTTAALEDFLRQD